MIQLSVNSKQLSVVSGNYQLSIMNWQVGKWGDSVIIKQ
ncbi:hypothetical protein MYAER_0383 [Microcystis aeruginosa NIES-2549]|uniref:Uncharacterized protein n=1 Tax=Microcystis aeruginosa NIES-2549 TaxID=1641812 RepID=A0A0F6RJA2_MICAE|nr:hypothetical protein MYAER_0383 [Microcystis aeruginosa NIES-2549]AOC51136.1 hypothetical protein amyaer_0385 [Microcystis aeruginosa NIES-2481]